MGGSPRRHQLRPYRGLRNEQSLLGKRMSQAVVPCPRPPIHNEPHQRPQSSAAILPTTSHPPIAPSMRQTRPIPKRTAPRSPFNSCEYERGPRSTVEDDWCGWPRRDGRDVRCETRNDGLGAGHEQTLVWAWIPSMRHACARGIDMKNTKCKGAEQENRKGDQDPCNTGRIVMI